MEVRELGHLVLYVRDLDRSARFYRDVLGWRSLQDPDEVLAFPAIAFSAPSGRTHHELLLIEVGEDAAPMPAGRRLGLYHFGLKVGDSDDDLREALASLRAHGVPVLGASDHTVTHSLYIADPDGNEIELYIDVPGWTGATTEPGPVPGQAAEPVTVRRQRPPPLTTGLRCTGGLEAGMHPTFLERDSQVDAVLGYAAEADAGTGRLVLVHG